MGNLAVTLVSAKNLIAADRGGFSDPFVLFKVNGKEVFKSDVVKKTVNPEFNEKFTVPIVRIVITLANKHNCLHLALLLRLYTYTPLLYLGFSR